MSEYVAPADRQSTVEQMVADLWRQVLHVDSVHPESDFFQLGGHSLTAMHVAALLERRLGRRIPLSAIFEYPTVAALAGYIQSPSDQYSEHRSASGKGVGA